MNLGERVKQRREMLGMTQEALAYKMGYKSKSSSTKIERGRSVTQKVIVKLAKALEVTPAYLMGWEEDSPVILFDTKTIVKAIDKAFPNDVLENLHKYSEIFVELDLDDSEMKKVTEYAKFIKSQRSDE